MGISKQSFHQYHDRLYVRLQEEAFLVNLIEEIRHDHPTMGCRDMYYKISPHSMGRDLFEEFCRQQGFTVTHPKNFRRTTDSTGVKRFDNLTINLELKKADQLWVSDITYIEVGSRFYYLTFVMDAFTRRILGYSTAIRLFTEETSLVALKMAIRARGKDKLSGLIFHSDGGGQYFDKQFILLTKDYEIINSMCKYSWENPYAERINGVIKNNYLLHRHINTFEQLKTEVDRAVKLYNNDKPHIGLHRLTPVEFEKCIFTAGKQSDGEKSATEHESLRSGGDQPSGLKGNNPQVQISLKNMNTNKVEHCQKTVNAI
jgi:transposase InsO family protein